MFRTGSGSQLSMLFGISGVESLCASATGLFTLSLSSLKIKWGRHTGTLTV